MKRPLKKKNALQFDEILFSAKFKCPNCETKVTTKVTEYDISGHSDECETCGSHGEITMDLKCPKCGRMTYIGVRSW